MVDAIDAGSLSEKEQDKLEFLVIHSYLRQIQKPDEKTPEMSEILEIGGRRQDSGGVR